MARVPWASTLGDRPRAEEPCRAACREDGGGDREVPGAWLTESSQTILALDIVINYKTSFGLFESDTVGWPWAADQQHILGHPVYVERYKRPHQKGTGTNMAFVDGHAEFVRVNDSYYLWTR